MEKNLKIDANTSVREIMQKFPATRKVFDQYGLLGCGGPEGPTEPVSLFARVHQMDLGQLLEQIHQVVSGEEESVLLAAPGSGALPQPAANAAEGRAVEDPLILPHLFIRTASLSFITGGCLAGAIFLVLISYYGTFEMARRWIGWTTHVQMHGHVQLSGWVTLFIMGLAYFALPRFLAVNLPQTSAMRASYWLMLGGILLRIFYQPFSSERWAANWVVWGALAELAAAVLFFRVVLQAARSSAKKNEPYVQFLKWGSGWLLVSQGILLVHAAGALVQGRAVLLSRPVDEAYLHLLLMGFVGLFIMGVTLRTLPLMLDFRRRAGESLQRRVLVAWNLAVALFAGGQLLKLGGGAWGESGVLAGAWLELLTGMAFLIALNPFQKPQASQPDGSPAEWLWLVRAAYFWFAVALLMEVVLAAWPVATGAALAPSYWGAFRHALTVGWISMMIFGMAYRMIPVMEGRALALAWTAPVVFWLANLGTLGRVGLQSLGATVPAVIPWMAPTGVVELSAGVFFTVAIWRTMRKSPESLREAAEPLELEIGLKIGPDTVVGKVLGAYPDSLDVFIRHGFTAMKNPALRAVASKMVTISQACRMHGIDLVALLRDLDSLANPKGTTLPDKPAPLAKTDSEKPVLVQLASAASGAAAGPERKKLEEDVWSVLRRLEDPEFPGISLMDLGLIYEVTTPSAQEVNIRMTLTSRDCPAASAITGAVRKRVEYTTSARCNVELVWEPPWTPDRITAAGRELLGQTVAPGKITS